MKKTRSGEDKTEESKRNTEEQMEHIRRNKRWRRMWPIAWETDGVWPENDWRTPEGGKKGRTMELQTIKWALEQAGVWNDMETPRMTGQAAGERWSGGGRWFIGPEPLELPIALQFGPDFYFILSGVFSGMKIYWLFSSILSEYGRVFDSRS